MSNPLISIVTPSFNQGPFIRETIESVLGQDYPNFEYWVIDGGSTDDTIKILNQVDDKRFHFISEPDNGQSDAIRKGFNLCKGEVIGWINSDDLLKPSCLLSVSQAFNSSRDIGLVYGNIEIVDAERKLIKLYKPLPLSYEGLLNNPKMAVVQPGSFYRKSCYEKVEGIDTNLHYVMDYDLFLKLLKTSKGYYIPQTLAEFRLHSTSKSYRFTGNKFIIEAVRVSYRHNHKIFTKMNLLRATRLVKGMVKTVLRMPEVNINKMRD